MPRLLELNGEDTPEIEGAIEAQLKYWAGTYIPALFDQKIYTPKMSQENGEAVGPDTIKKLACVSPDPDDHVKFAQRYIDLGFTHLIFHSAAPDQRAFIEGYWRAVLPRTRSSRL